MLARHIAAPALGLHLSSALHQAALLLCIFTSLTLPPLLLPRRYWLVAATQTSIKIWDLESKSVVDDLRPEFQTTFSKKATVPYCVSLAWSADGSTLYSGYTDGQIRVWTVSHM